MDIIAEYRDDQKPDVYVIYESAYLNIIVYIIGTFTVFLLLGKKWKNLNLHLKSSSLLLVVSANSF